MTQRIQKAKSHSMSTYLEVRGQIWTSYSWSLCIFPITLKGKIKWMSSCSVVTNSLQPHGLYSPWNSLGQKTGVSSLSLLQGIFPTQGPNPGLPHCRWILYQLNRKRIYNRVFFSLKKEGNSNMCSNLDEPWWRYAKWKKPVTKE